MQTEAISNLNSYKTYFASGGYDRRYQGPNRRMLRKARSLLPAAGRFIDYGCGSGRYLLPLARHARHAIGFDACSEALKLLKGFLGANPLPAVQLTGPAPAQLLQAAEQVDGVDLALCLFGVLAHIDDAATRAETLRLLGQCLAPNGVLLVSVPNRQRRFLAEQKAANGQTQIRYIRVLDGISLPMSYQLYDCKSLVAELERAGFTVDSIGAESFLPEAIVCRYRWLGWIDDWLCRLLPARFGYGIYAIARLRQCV